jgi:hypothetical protein
MKSRPLSICALAMALALSACASPEAARSRGGGPGADLGNRAAVVQMHAGSKMYYKTPCRTAKVKCSGPLPSAGT